MKFAQTLLQTRSAIVACCLVVLLAANATAGQAPAEGQSSPPASTSTPTATPAASAAVAEAPPSDLTQRAWKALKAGTNDDNKQKRATAVRVLGLIPGDSQSQKIADGALSDKEAEVRAAAAEALGQMGAKKSRTKLRRALNDKDSEVILAAANALRTMGDHSAYAVYYAMLTGKMKPGRGLIKEQHEMLKDPKKLALFGFEQGIGQIPFAGIGYHAFKTLAKDDSSPARAAAAKVLSRDPEPQAAEALTEAATGDKSWIVRAAALDAIAHRGDSSLLPKIAPSLSDDRDEVRMTAAATIIRLSKKKKSTK